MHQHRYLKKKTKFLWRILIIVQLYFLQTFDFIKAFDTIEFAGMTLKYYYKSKKQWKMLCCLKRLQVLII